MKFKAFFLAGLFLTTITETKAIESNSQNISAVIALKVPGNFAKSYDLTLNKQTENTFECTCSENIPVDITRKSVSDNGKDRITVTLKAKEDVYFNYSELFNTRFSHDDCQFYMPGFWYRRNMRSPEKAPSFKTSDSWIVREDRLSTPLTSIFNPKDGKSFSVLRIDDFDKDALITHKEGEVILSGETSIGFTGFENVGGKSMLSYGFPFKEAPKSYIRKLTLAPSVEAFQFLAKGKSITLTWELAEIEVDNFSDCVQHIWEYSYDTYKPEVIKDAYSIDKMKEVMSNFFVESYVDDHDIHYYSGVELLTYSCESTDVAQVGFVGRTLLNAYNALEYGEANNRQDLIDDANSIFDTYAKNGFTQADLFKESFHLVRGRDEGRSIRRQSEGIYAVLNYLQYEKENSREHPEWEARIKKLLDIFLSMQKEDGSFPRRFDDDLTIQDPSGGSTPSATLPMVMAYKYFKDKKYLNSAKKTVEYLENEIISKADYFSSTLDANCEDKEASLYAATAAYYLALVTKGKEQEHYAELARKASYFALSWYYTWDVPFAQGQMLGDVGLKTRGWGNVSVENNHIDVFIFEFTDVLRWVSKRYADNRLSDFAEVISTSMRQLLPFEGHMCEIAKVGYYPEVVQHTYWDYGKNGKGYYNNYFAPGWTVASLWELLTPGRAEAYFAK
ncbi:MAG: hypothetical protein ACK5LF_02830 [Bacteroides xylanisolvens]